MMAEYISIGICLRMANFFTHEHAKKKKTCTMHARAHAHAHAHAHAQGSSESVTDITAFLQFINNVVWILRSYITNNFQLLAQDD